MNKEIRETIEKWNLEGVQVCEYAYITHYRSVDNSGVRLDGDIVVCVGAPWSPQDSYKPYQLIYGYDAGWLRDQEMAEVTQNALGRGKDPTGKKRSIVFMLGVNWGTFKKYYPNKKEVVRTYKVGGLPSRAHWLAWLWNEETPFQCKYEDYHFLPAMVEILYWGSVLEHEGVHEVPFSELIVKALRKYPERIGRRKRDIAGMIERCGYMMPPRYKIEDRHGFEYKTLVLH